jgi:acyl carrier protein
MNRVEIKSQLLALVEQETGESHTAVDEHRSLKEGLGQDSIDLLGLVMRVEQHFAVRIENQELWRLQTISDLLDLLQAKLAAADAGKAVGAS